MNSQTEPASRRKFLTLAASAATCSAVIAAPTVSPRLATVAPAPALDPTFGLIEAHRAACLAHEAACVEQNRLEAVDDPLAETISEAPCHTEWAAWDSLLETVPPTLAGLTAWSAYLEVQRQTEPWRLDEDAARQIVGTLAAALGSLAVAS
jgi:hypothetical protein